MREELELFQVDDCGELENYFLGVRAELGRLPAPAVDGGVQQLRDGEVGVLAGAVDDAVLELRLARLKGVVGVELILRHLNYN